MKINHVGEAQSVVVSVIEKKVTLTYRNKNADKLAREQRLITSVHAVVSFFVHKLTKKIIFFNIS